ncbi:MAG TPA: hypothetical protein PLU21_02640 [Candidatus Saccharibacteria bacterium]|nr:hypothetical protein [Candidatus Saccharibacteria bacterium]
MNDLFLAAAMFVTMLLPSLTVFGIVVLSHSYRRPLYVAVAAVLTHAIALMVWMYSWQVRPTWNINTVPGFTITCIVILNAGTICVTMVQSWRFDQKYEKDRFDLGYDPERSRVVPIPRRRHGA